MITIIFENNKKIIIEYASTFFERFIGLMGKSKFNGLIFKQKYSNKYLSTIHTMFMKKSIDLIYVDNNLRIQEITTLKPWHIHIPKNNNTKYIIELPADSCQIKNIKINTKIQIINITQ